MCGESLPQASDEGLGRFTLGFLPLIKQVFPPFRRCGRLCGAVWREPFWQPSTVKGVHGLLLLAGLLLEKFTRQAGRLFFHAFLHDSGRIEVNVRAQVD